MKQNIGHKIVDVAPLMEYYRNKLLIDGDDPAIEAALEELRKLPTLEVEKYQTTNISYWIPMSRGSKCAECKQEISKYQPETKYCPNCGKHMISKEAYEKAVESGFTFWVFPAKD